MTKREDLLSRAWTGPQLEIGGKPVILSPVWYSLLEYWKNPLFCGVDKSPSAQSNASQEVNGMGEILMLCSGTKEDAKALQRLTKQERADKVLEFLIEHEEEYDAASQGIQERLESIRAAMVESESPGKEDAQVHAS